MDRLSSYAAAFGRFWYNFIIGDDWTLATAAAAGIAANLVLHYALGLDSAWYVLPVIVLAALGASVFRHPYKD